MGTTAPSLTLSLEEVNPGPMGAELPSAGPRSLHPWWEIKEPNERNTCYSSPIGTCFPLQPPNPHPLLILLRNGFSPLPASPGDAIMEIRRGTFTNPKIHGWTSAPIVHRSLAPTVRVALLVWHCLHSPHPFMRAP